MYNHGGKYSIEVQNIFKEKSVEERLPDSHCVVALMKKFEQTESVQDRPRCGCPSVMQQIFIEYAYVYGIYSAFWFSVMLSLMNKYYRIHIACTVFY